jgi:GNAT superfamily N-acetyltransferase
MIMRSIQLEDVCALLVMMRAMQADDPWSVPFVESRAREAVELMLRNPSYGQGWFIEDEGRRVGYIILSFDYSLEYGGRNAWVDEFFIERESRGHGLGAHALEFFEQAAHEAGATAIHLEVNEGNRAIGLYRRRGFEDHHRYLMTKRLVK